MLHFTLAENSTYMHIALWIIHVALDGHLKSTSFTTPESLSVWLTIPSPYSSNGGRGIFKIFEIKM